MREESDSPPLDQHRHVPSPAERERARVRDRDTALDCFHAGYAFNRRKLSHTRASAAQGFGLRRSAKGATAESQALTPTLSRSAGEGTRMGG
jgi:hypothetical protein